MRWTRRGSSDCGPPWSAVDVTHFAEPTGGVPIRGPRWAEGPRLVLQTWLGTRLLMGAVLVWLMVTEGRTPSQMLANWDVAHFLAIAADGYAERQDVAFFPGWPLLLRFFAGLGVPGLLAGVLLALACSGFAAAALYRMAGTSAAVAWLLAPVAIFTAVPYTESLFCAAAFWAWERALSRRWGQAAALAAVAAGVRVSGVFLIGALAILALSQSGPALERLRRLVWLALPSLVVGAYLWYLRGLTGSWTAWYQAQADGWSRGFTLPWVSLQQTIDAAMPGAYADHPEWSWLFRAELVSMAVGLLVTLVMLLRRRWAEAAWVGVQVAAFATSYWFISVTRAVLLWFPLWIGLGRLAEGRGRPGPAHRLVVGAVVVAALGVQTVWSWLFLTGRWAG